MPSESPAHDVEEEVGGDQQAARREPARGSPAEPPRHDVGEHDREEPARPREHEPQQRRHVVAGEREQEGEGDRQRLPRRPARHVERAVGELAAPDEPRRRVVRGLVEHQQRERCQRQTKRATARGPPPAFEDAADADPPDLHDARGHLLQRLLGMVEPPHRERLTRADEAAGQRVGEHLVAEGRLQQQRHAPDDRGAGARDLGGEQARAARRQLALEDRPAGAVLVDEAQKGRHRREHLMARVELGVRRLRPSPRAARRRPGPCRPRRGPPWTRSRRRASAWRCRPGRRSRPSRPRGSRVRRRPRRRRRASAARAPREGPAVCPPGGAACASRGRAYATAP